MVTNTQLWMYHTLMRPEEKTGGKVLAIPHNGNLSNGRMFELVETFSDEAMDLLLKYNWPGNIRELENLIERMSVLVEEDIIQTSDLPEKIRGNVSRERSVTQVPFDSGIGFNEAVEQYQKDLILQALNQTNWVKAKAADLLKMNRTTLVEKIKKMKLKSTPFAKSEKGVSDSVLRNFRFSSFNPR